MPDAPPIIADLVARFDNDAARYRSQAFNETQTRIEFINPLFTALGWDMDNTAGYADAYRDVIHEAALKIGGETKAPDYCFRIGGTRKFFLAATKPGHERDALQRRIDATDARIDRMVYDLYGLTEDEIKIVEEATVR